MLHIHIPRSRYTLKIFGNQTFTSPSQSHLYLNDAVATMDGFYHYENGAHGDNETDADFVMRGFAPEELPVTTTLAEEFAVFDSWFAAFPGPSWPNHLYSITGTSAGCTETSKMYQCTKGPNAKQFPQATIFDSLQEAGHDWMVIYNDSKHETYIESLTTPNAAEHTFNMDEFFHRAEHGTLPTVTWIGPREGTNASMGDLGNPNSDHPSCCDVALGERLRKDIYEALRNGKGWNETAFIFTWDDPGGFYDHVKPPGTGSAPAPDDIRACNPGDESFEFNRLGSRLPVVLVSPWVQRGTVIHKPTRCEGKGACPTSPTPTSEFDGTSIISSIKNIFGLPNFLTRRDAWSGSFHNHLGEGMTEPRTDTPYHLPDAPEPAAARKRRERIERRSKRRLAAGEVLGLVDSPREMWDAMGYTDEDLDDDDDSDDDDAECDDPSRRMRRSIRAFELINNVTAPPRLHACAHTEPYWLNTCEPGTMAEATQWLAEQTENWRRRR